MRINAKPALYFSNFTKESPKGSYAENDQKAESGTDRQDYAMDEDVLAEEEFLTEAEKIAEAIKSNSKLEPKENGADKFKVSCSIPDDSTGQLAAMLSRAETQMDVQQVSSKALRALNALKMSAIFAEGDDAKKVAQRIRRMEKLINRISKKQQQLNKEQVLELQRRSAEKRKELQREQKLSRELDTRRTKRRRDERNYANKEIAEDNKEASSEMYANMADATAASSAPTPDLSAFADLGGAAAELSMAEGASFDVTV
ncbi:MAG: hypothetical protein HFG82_02935 [Dorea sp.]|jgi:hypothetical protein|nr:hypothetical protein [Dorea sp.]